MGFRVGAWRAPSSDRTRALSPHAGGCYTAGSNKGMQHRATGKCALAKLCLESRAVEQQDPQRSRCKHPLSHVVTHPL
eukprot:6205407-Amphidinium_carterae.1